MIKMRIQIHVRHDIAPIRLQNYQYFMLKILHKSAQFLRVSNFEKSLSQKKFNWKTDYKISKSQHSFKNWKDALYT